MEEALKAASGEGNIDALYKLIEKDPEILDSFNKVQFVHTPFHEAAKAGQEAEPSRLGSPSRVLVTLRSWLFHIRHVIDEAEEPEERRRRKNETALALIKLDAELIRVKGRERMTPLHHARKLEALDVLLGWLLRRNREDVFGFKDEHRNTALYIAVETEQAEIDRL
nr:ankyrin repeat-containing protein BDA1-like [Coffea arabica]